jgi:predicted Zn-ribbon and HTH transcriptional regulator
MNTRLQKLFENYNISDKDCYEIKQIFQIVTDEKKHKILSSFDILAKKIKKIEKDISLEQEILLNNILPDIKKIFN